VRTTCFAGCPPTRTSEGPATSSVPGADATAAARAAIDGPLVRPRKLTHGSARAPSGKLDQKSMASAPCGPTVDLLSEMLPFRPQPYVRNENENRTPSTIRDTLRKGKSSADPISFTYSRVRCSHNATDSSVSRTPEWVSSGYIIPASSGYTLDTQSANGSQISGEKIPVSQPADARTICPSRTPSPPP